MDVDDVPELMDVDDVPELMDVDDMPDLMDTLIKPSHGLPIKKMYRMRNSWMKMEPPGIELISKKNNLKKETPNQDSNQRMNVIVQFMIELYRVLTSSLLILFVPQECNGELCTLSDNIQWDPELTYNVAIVVNFITLGSFLGLYIIEAIRENRLIKYLDVNPELSNDNDHVKQATLILPMEKYSKILNIDRLYQIVSYISITIYGINVILSSIIINEYYFGSQTASTLLTYILFMATKLNNVYTICNTEKHIFLSAYLKTNVQYNDVDHTYKRTSTEV